MALLVKDKAAINVTRYQVRDEMVGRRKHHEMEITSVEEMIKRNGINMREKNEVLTLFPPWSG